MSTNIPESFSKKEYTQFLNHLTNCDLSQYVPLIKENYKKPKGKQEYLLKSDITIQICNKLDYVYKRSLDTQKFESLEEIAQYLRLFLEDKKYILLFAYNGTGKTRLSVEFKAMGQVLNEENGEKKADTLYYNAFTEDLFYWDNDLENDTDRFLKLNSDSRFFSGLKELEMESRIRLFLHRYGDFDFTIDYDDYKIVFHRNVMLDGVSKRVDNIKVSRGEENIFIWCFFLATLQLVVDKVESYGWVKYIYIDDPISSLDDNNAIAVAGHLSSLIHGADIKVVISTHHALFYNVLCNELDTSEKLFFQKRRGSGGYILKNTGNTPFFHHVALLKELKKVSDSGEIYTYHFNILRNILEKTASFHGYKNFSSCLRKDKENSIVYGRIVNLLSHGNYSIFDPKEMVEENKEYFRIILDNFLEDYKFNRNIFEEKQSQEEDV